MRSEMDLTYEQMDAGDFREEKFLGLAYRPGNKVVSPELFAGEAKILRIIDNPASPYDYWIEFEDGFTMQVSEDEITRIKKEH